MNKLFADISFKFYGRNKVKSNSNVFYKHYINDKTRKRQSMGGNML